MELAATGRYRLILSAVIMEESKRALAEPKLLRAYGHAPAAIRDFCDGLAAVAWIVEGDPGFRSKCRDPNDHHVIAIAVRAAAGLIVPCDQDLPDLGHHGAIRTLTPRRFLDQLARR